MSDGRMTSLQQTDAFLANRRLAEKIFDAGAEMFCCLCDRRSFKSPEEMAVYLGKWPFCSGTRENPHKRKAAEVRLREKHHEDLQPLRRVIALE